MKDDDVVYISGQEAAKRLGCAPITVSRIARQHSIGVIVEGGRLAALATTDLPRVKAHLHATRGNPDWIAAAKVKPRTRSRRTG